MKNKEKVTTPWTAFSKFHPLTGKMPNEFSIQFLWIAKSARSLIKKRRKSQCVFAAEFLRKLVLIGEESIVLNSPEMKIDETSFVSDVLAIQKVRRNIKLETIEDDLPGITWSELFALNALATIGEYFLLDSESTRPAHFAPSKDKATIIVEILFRSMQSLSAAELALKEEKISFILAGDIKNLTAETQHQKAAKSKNKGKKELASKYIEFYLLNSHKYASYEKCLQAFLDINDPKVIEHEGMLQDRLRSFLKEHPFYNLKSSL